ncbi:O-antigen acetylase [Yeosuana aromativorans]|uniref:O-antigen acetylase n=1 Tax=Yeosuana aromativorans TaxID=288019 RepID=A0A8J3FEL5_9FLAO|nr:acyltransferase [Yeosuana aromativorans]GGK17484.1 O-antigen acetylase [Yeosuana aromativorans]
MHKNNNFDFLRFLFAVLVVVSHAYPLSGSHESSQWIYQITNGQIVIAQIGLSGFFIISGYFIFQSLSRSKNLLDYYKKRFLRLFPALAVVLLICLIITPFMYQGEVPLFKNKEVYTYLPYNLSLYGFQSGIKGVFDNNPYHAINGSLWTIRHEFTLYIGLSVLFFFKNHKKYVQWLLLMLFITINVTFVFYRTRFDGSSFLGMNIFDTLNLGTFFIFGSFLASIEFEKINNKKILLLIATLVLFLSIYFDFYSSMKHILLTIIVLLIGFMPIPFMSNFGKIGDMSYGIYIYSFPIQQTLMYYFKMDTLFLMFYSVIISIIFGYFSWHLIERKALSYKNVPVFKTKFNFRSVKK